jgi:hypothetical protein
MKLGRNDPCPCGSGLKYKRCCGAARKNIAGLEPVLESSSMNRSCGECTACCDGWLKINIHGHDVFPGKPCPYSTGKSCRIYVNRPDDPCRQFVCAWLAKGSRLPEAFRPDRLGVIILNSTWRGAPCYGLVPAGRDPDDALIGWMNDFSVATGSPFWYSLDGKLYAYGPPEFQRDMRSKMDRGEKLWS